MTSRRQEELSPDMDGFSELPEHVCLAILSKLSTKEIVQSVMPVCKSWRDVGFQATGRHFMVTGTLGRQLLKVKNEIIVTSLIDSLVKRAGTLITVALSLDVESSELRRLCLAIAKCKQLKVLDITSTLDKKMGVRLPPKLQILRSNFPWKALQTDRPDLKVLGYAYSDYYKSLQQAPMHDNLRAMVFNSNPEVLFERTGNLTKLEYLEIFAPMEVSRATDLAMLIPSLKVLNLMFASLEETGVDQLGSHPNLEKVVVRGNSMMDFGYDALLQLLQVPSLYSLQFGGSHTYGFLLNLLQEERSALEKCKLVHLSIQIFWIGNVNLSLFSALQSLKSLDIQSSNYSVEPSKTWPIHKTCAIRLLNHTGFREFDRQHLRALGFKFGPLMIAGHQICPDMATLNHTGLTMGLVGVTHALRILGTECRDYKPYSDFVWESQQRF